MQNYQCKQCGANIFWDPNEGSLKCGFCGNSYQPSDYEDLTLTTDENDATDKKAATDGLNQAEDDMVIYECGNCSGEVIALKTTMATICPYCGEAVSITSKAVGDFRPVKCLPFKIGKEKVKKLYKDYVKTTTRLAPSKFLAESEIEKIQGLYVPFYYNDIETHLNAGFIAEKKNINKRRERNRASHNHISYFI